MRITYQWTDREWDQALSVATRKSTRGTPLPGMIYALIGIPLLGAIGDIVSLVRSSGRITVAGSILPMLLVLFALTAAVLIGMAQMRRRRQRGSVAPMPPGAREMVLQESGWRFSAQNEPDQPRPAAPVAASINAVSGESGDPAAATQPLRSTDAGLPLTVPLRSWSELLEARQGSGVIVLVHREGFEAVPTKALTPEQAGHLHRLVMRKMKPVV